MPTGRRSCGCPSRRCLCCPDGDGDLEPNLDSNSFQVPALILPLKKQARTGSSFQKRSSFIARGKQNGVPATPSDTTGLSPGADISDMSPLDMATSSPQPRAAIIPRQKGPSQAFCLCSDKPCSCLEPSLSYLASAEKLRGRLTRSSRENEHQINGEGKLLAGETTSRRVDGSSVSLMGKMKKKGPGTGRRACGCAARLCKCGASLTSPATPKLKAMMPQSDQKSSDSRGPGTGRRACGCPSRACSCGASALCLPTTRSPPEKDEGKPEPSSTEKETPQAEKRVGPGLGRRVCGCPARKCKCGASGRIISSSRESVDKKLSKTPPQNLVAKTRSSPRQSLVPPRATFPTQPGSPKTDCRPGTLLFRDEGRKEDERNVVESGNKQFEGQVVGGSEGDAREEVVLQEMANNVQNCGHPANDEAEQGGQQNGLAAIKRKRRSKRRRAPTDEVAQLKARVKTQIGRIRLEQNMLDIYTAEGWQGRSRELLRPESELHRARAQVVLSKLAVRKAVEELHVLSMQGAIDQEVFDQEGRIAHDEIFCAKCASKKTGKNNDIILCDGECNRAFHQKCLVPHLRTQDIPPGDEGWLCPACNCKVDCIEAVNSTLGIDLALDCKWEAVFPEVATVDSPSGARDVEEDLLPSEDSQDENYGVNGDSSDSDSDDGNDDEDEEGREEEDGNNDEGEGEDEDKREGGEEAWGLEYVTTELEELRRADEEEGLRERQEEPAVGGNRLVKKKTGRGRPSGVSSLPGGGQASGHLGPVGEPAPQIGRAAHSRQVAAGRAAGHSAAEPIELADGCESIGGGQACVLSEKRKRNKVDYVKLNEELFGPQVGEGQPEEDDDDDDDFSLTFKRRRPPLGGAGNSGVLPLPCRSKPTAKRVRKLPTTNEHADAPSEAPAPAAPAASALLPGHEQPSPLPLPPGHGPSLPEANAVLSPGALHAKMLAPVRGVGQTGQAPPHGDSADVQMGQAGEKNNAQLSLAKPAMSLRHKLREARGAAQVVPVATPVSLVEAPQIEFDLELCRGESGSRVLHNTVEEAGGEAKNGCQSRLSEDALEVLRAAFAVNQSPKTTHKRELAAHLRLPYKEVNRWFRRTRAVARKAAPAAVARVLARAPPAATAAAALSSTPMLTPTLLPALVLTPAATASAGPTAAHTPPPTPTPNPSPTHTATQTVRPVCTSAPCDLAQAPVPVALALAALAPKQYHPSHSPGIAARLPPALPMATAIFPKSTGSPRGHGTTLPLAAASTVAALESEVHAVPPRPRNLQDGARTPVAVAVPRLTAVGSPLPTARASRQRLRSHINEPVLPALGPQPAIAPSPTLPAVINAASPVSGVASDPPCEVDGRATEAQVEVPALTHPEPESPVPPSTAAAAPVMTPVQFGAALSVMPSYGLPLPEAGPEASPCGSPLRVLSRRTSPRLTPRLTFSSRPVLATPVKSANFCKHSSTQSTSVISARASVNDHVEVDRKRAGGILPAKALIIIKAVPATQGAGSPYISGGKSTCNVAARAGGGGELRPTQGTPGSAIEVIERKTRGMSQHIPESLGIGTELVNEEDMQRLHGVVLALPCLSSPSPSMGGRRGMFGPSSGVEAVTPALEAADVAGGDFQSSQADALSNNKLKQLISDAELKLKQLRSALRNRVTT